MPMPYHGREFTFSQPDGKEIVLKSWGNQYYAVFEDLEGYTVIKDPETGFYQYAKLSTDKTRFESTGANVSESDPKKLGIEKHLRITKEQAKIKSLEAVQEMGNKPRWQERIAERKSVQLRALEAEGPFTAPPKEERKGKYVGLCLLIEFPDDKGTIQKSEVENYCNQQGYSGFGNKGSVHDYYWDVSNGKLDYTNIVASYYTAKNKKSYYTDPAIPCGQRARELINEALTDLKNKGFDFSKLTVDNQNYVYALNAFYAGSCPNNWNEGLWPHSWGLATPFDIGNNRKIRDYQITDMGSDLSIATYCHENGHMVCDFPDLYDYGYESYGDGIYCLMAFGGSDEKNPAEVCAYLKYKVGWSDRVTDISEGTYTVDSNINDFYLFKNTNRPFEYFIIENRFKEKRDNSLPASGLAVWHVDETGSNNDQDMAPTKHYECSLEQADNKFDLERKKNIGDAGDLYSAPVYSKFGKVTTPNSKWWDGTASGLDLVDITQPNKQISFKSVKSSKVWPNGRRINNADSTPKAVDSCVFKNKLYNFWKANDSSNKIYYSASTDGVVWPNGKVINNADSTPEPLSTVIFNNKLYLFWKANDSGNKIYYSASTDGVTWPNGKVINNADSTPKALHTCVFKNKLYLFWKANDPSNKIYYSASTDGVTWPNGKVINNADSTPEPLSTVIFNNKLYVFWKANDSSNKIYYSASTDGVTWPNGKVINNADSTPTAVDTIVYNNNLYVFWKANDPSNKIYYSASTDGVTWPNGKVINNADSTPEPLSTVIFNNKLYIFWKANDSSNKIYYSA